MHTARSLCLLAVAVASAVMTFAATGPGGAPAAAATSAPRTARLPTGTGRAGATVRNGALIADSCTSPAACTAVGVRANNAGTQVTLAERWNGTSWRVQRTPNPAGAIFSSLYGVSCTSADSCIAVGGYNNGSQHGLTLAERWNGTSWRIQRTPNLGTNPTFTAISCTSERACTAVGHHDNGADNSVPLAEQWNGKRWRVQTVPNPGGDYTTLLAVSCSSPRACTAAGTYTNSAGLELTLAERWDGTRWRIQPSPNPADFTISSVFFGVSCTAADACIAVGSYYNPAQIGLSLAERWNGKSWRIQATPNPAGSIYTAFAGLSCSAASACTAVGYHDNSADKELTLAERWNGARWRIQATPNAPHAKVGTNLSGVSCPTVRSCTAAGSFFTHEGLAAGTLAEGWNGTNWRIIQP
jgi:hypothetical protein